LCETIANGNYIFSKAKLTTDQSSPWQPFLGDNNIETLAYLSQGEFVIDLYIFLNFQERLEHQRQRKQQAESLQAEQNRLNEERKHREIQRRRQELQDIEKKQAMDKIAALKKTTVGAKALKDLTPEVKNLQLIGGRNVYKHLLYNDNIPTKLHNRCCALICLMIQSLSGWHQSYRESTQVTAN
jgi:hypothetical protein